MSIETQGLAFMFYMNAFNIGITPGSAREIDESAWLVSATRWEWPPTEGSLPHTGPYPPLWHTAPTSEQPDNAWPGGQEKCDARGVARAHP